MIHSYKELIVWQKSIKLVKELYLLTESFPKTEIFGITSQMRRAAVSIPSNIAEGYGRRSHKEYLQFYAIAYGSALELETQLVIAKELEFVSEKEVVKTEALLNEVIKMLYVMVYKRKEESTVNRN